MKLFKYILICLISVLSLTSCTKKEAYDYRKFFHENKNTSITQKISVKFKDMGELKDEDINDKTFKINIISKEFNEVKIINDILNIVDNATEIRDIDEYNDFLNKSEIISNRMHKDPFGKIEVTTSGGKNDSYSFYISPTNPRMGFLKRGSEEIFQLSEDDSVYINSFMRLEDIDLNIDPRVSEIFNKKHLTLDYIIDNEKYRLPDKLRADLRSSGYPLYWAQVRDVLEKSPDGLALNDYLGKSIKIETYKIRENASLKDDSNLDAYERVGVALKKGDKIIGVYHYIDGDYYPRNLNGDTVNVIKNKKFVDWIEDNFDFSDEFSRTLAKKTPEELVNLYVKALNDANVEKLNAININAQLNNFYKSEEEFEFIPTEEDFENMSEEFAHRFRNIERINIEKSWDRILRSDIPVYRARVKIEYNDAKVGNNDEKNSRKEKKNKSVGTNKESNIGNNEIDTDIYFTVAKVGDKGYRIVSVDF